MTDKEFDQIISLVTEKTGIIPRESHKFGIKKFLEKKIGTFSFEEYFRKILISKQEFEELVNGSTINETYFFREEKQFQFLQNSVFPNWISKNGNKTMKIWSAACSEGEEPYSIALLADSCKINVSITASDINTNVLEKCRKGVYSSNAIRLGDGEKYKSLLAPYKKDSNIVFSDKIRSKITTIRVNLSELGISPVSIQKQDVIFLRNVFIYFSRDMRKRILSTMAEKYLSDGGILIVSMSEIAQIDGEITPPSLEKVFDGNVFYFKKK